MKVKMKYTIIKTRDQYDQYCDQLETMVSKIDNHDFQDEIELLTLLIERYDEEHNTFETSDPVELLRSLMQEHHLKSSDMTDILGISKGYVSDILHYKKGLSKEVIRKLAHHFKMKQEAFNRPYSLISQVKTHQSNTLKFKQEHQISH